MCRALSCVLWIVTCLLYISVVVNGDVETENPVSRSCASNSQERRLYVSTVDGILTALDTNGQPLWSYSSQEPLFKSTLSYSEASESVPNLIPGLDRALYHWDGNKLQTLPFRADDLIDSDPFSEGQGSTLAGSKARDVVGINVQNGKPLYECTPLRCHRYDNNSLIQRIDVLKASISRVTVREANELTGEEMWNFTVGDLHLSLVEGAQDEDEDFSCHTSAHLPWKLQVDTVTGVLYAVDRVQSTVVWQKKLSAPVVSVWLHEGGRLEKIHVLTQQGDTSDLNYPSLMLVRYNSQYYIQHVVRGAGRNFQGVAITEGGADIHMGEVTTCPQNRENEATVDQLVELYYIQTFYLFKPPDFESNSDSDLEYETGTRALTLYPDENSFEEMCTSGPNGLAVYFYLDFNHHYTDCGSGEENGSTGEGKACPSPSGEHSNSFVPERKSNWLVSTAWSAVKYVLFGLFVLGLSHIRRYHHMRRSNSNSNGSTVDLDNNFPVLTHLHTAIVDKVKRNSSSTISPNASTETLTSSVESQKQLNIIAESRVLPRFDSDYELKGHLGKGGFGVVYHVQNKIDGGEYAIKRIKLPTSKSSKEKVMREVHALAQLDHPRIVRYFHSWVEKAPAGWNEMEEWMPLSRRPSYGGEVSSFQPSEVPTGSAAAPVWSNCSQSNNSHINISRINSSFLNSRLTPCPSFNSLNHSAIHSVIPPVQQLTSDSRSSSFVIEFKEDSQQLQVNGSQKDSLLDPEGCFSRDLLHNRDDFSMSSSCSYSTEDRSEERRDSICDLVLEPPTYLFIQMQLCRKESLKDWLAKNVLNRKKETVMHFFEQTLEAVLYVHKKGMMHRDLKPSNIFFSLDGQIKVGDFGLVTGSAFGNFGNSYLALKTLGEDHKQHTGNIGSTFYISPEQMSGIKYNNKVDIFSLGVIFFELHYPFSTQMERAKELDNLRNQKFPPRFKTHLPLEAEFIEWLMNPIASQRPSAKEVADSERLRILRENTSRAEVNLIPKL